MSSEESKKQELLKYLTVNEAQLRFHSDSLLHVASSLTPSEHTLALMFVLSARLDEFQKLSHSQWSDWISIAMKFLNNFNPEDAAYDIKRMYRVAQVVSHITLILSANLYSEALTDLYLGLLNVVKLTSRPQELTPLHADIARLALMLKRPHLALPLLEQDYCSVTKKQTGLEAKQVILFFYYGGSIWLSLKNFERAADYYNACISTPSTAIHAACVEAYKKLILARLISEGAVASIPRFASGILQRYLRQVVDLYNDLAIIYTRESPQALKNFIDANSELFLKDKNHGLIKQLVKARTRRFVKQLTNSYTTVSLADIAQQSANEPRQVEAILLQMIEEGDLDARIDQEHGIVFFEERSVTGLYDAYEEQALKLLSLLQTSDQRLKELMLDQDYVRETLRMKEHGAGGPGLLSDLA